VIASLGNLRLISIQEGLKLPAGLFGALSAVEKEELFLHRTSEKFTHKNHYTISLSLCKVGVSVIH